jgi:hypothetical protein
MKRTRMLASWLCYDQFEILAFYKVSLYIICRHEAWLRCHCINPLWLFSYYSWILVPFVHEANTNISFMAVSWSLWNIGFYKVSLYSIGRHEAWLHGYFINPLSLFRPLFANICTICAWSSHKCRLRGRVFITLKYWLFAKFLCTSFADMKPGFMSASLTLCCFLGYFLQRFVPFLHVAATNFSFVAVVWSVWNIDFSQSWLCDAEHWFVSVSYPFVHGSAMILP